MNPIIIQAVVRHVLTLVAGGFFAKYGVDGETANAIIGGAAAAAGVSWSIYDKRNSGE